METPNGAANTVGGRFRHQPEQMVHPPFAWQLASFPSLPVCGEEAPYCPLRDFAILRHTPRKSRHSKPFSTCHQYIRNWSGLSAAECPITGDVFCVASSPGIASDRPWPTLLKATTTHNLRIHIRFPGSSSAQPCPVLRQGNHFLLRQISESAGGLPDSPSRAEERGDKHIRQCRAREGHGFPSVKPKMIRESPEAEYPFNERLKRH